MDYPENFTSMRSHEDQITKDSLGFLFSQEHLLDHLEMIDVSMQALHYFAVEKGHIIEGPNDLAVKLLGIRIFNASASAHKLSLAGYYQSATVFLRDILETLFLLDYFRMHPEKIEVWRTCSDKERQDLFGPVTIRKALDERDGATGKKRKEIYKLYSQLGTHATPVGFAMLRKKVVRSTNLARSQISPF